MSEYNEYSLYRQELIRLYNFIGNLSNELDEKYSSCDVLIPFIIGSYIEIIITGNYVRCSNRIKLISDKTSKFGKMIVDFFHNFVMSVID